MRTLGIPDGYRGRASDCDFLGHLAVMETISLPLGATRPWQRAVVVERDVGSGAITESGQARRPRVPVEDFEARWQEILGELGAAWINIVPIDVQGGTLIVEVEYKVATDRTQARTPDEVAISCHCLPARVLRRVLVADGEDGGRPAPGE